MTALSREGLTGPEWTLREPPPGTDPPSAIHSDIKQPWSARSYSHT